MSTFFLLEHPGWEPWDKPHSASIWRISLVALLLRFPNVQNLHVHQGYFDAASPKPTRFMTANAIPEAASYLQQFQTHLFLPMGCSIGRTNDGKWRTAQLKAYPPALRKAIVALADVSLRNQHWQPSEESPAWFHNKLDSMCRFFDSNAEVGPDFAGWCARIDN